MTPGERERVKKLTTTHGGHVLAMSPNGKGHQICDLDATDWPCDAVLLQERVVALEAEAKKLRQKVTGRDDYIRMQMARFVQMEEALREMLSAIERVTENFKHAIANRPVRDMAETLGEVEHAEQSARKALG